MVALFALPMGIGLRSTEKIREVRRDTPSGAGVDDPGKFGDSGVGSSERDGSD